jgi:hypothetical protein
MVHFGPQAPSALGKYFSIVLYKSLGSGSVADSIIAQEDLFQVQYETGYNGFSSYAFHTPVRLDTGTYYMGITQPANFGSDSIYYGLDVNRNTNLQHLSYNVDGTWYASTTAGSLMMRPIVGQDFVATLVEDVVKEDIKNLTLYPNPAPAILHLQTNETLTECAVYTLDGTLLYKQSVSNNMMDIGRLKTGDYLFVFRNAKGQTLSRKINKL